MSRLVRSRFLALAWVLSSLPRAAWAQFMEETPAPPKAATPAPPQPWVAPQPRPVPPPSPPSTTPPKPAASPASQPPPSLFPPSRLSPGTTTPAPAAVLKPAPAPVAPPAPAPAAITRGGTRTPMDIDEERTTVHRARVPGHPAPFMKVGYRRLSLKNLDTTAEDFTVNAFELDLYPISRKWVRLGTELQIGAASGPIQGKPSTNWYTVTGYSLGFQYPYRVTPFLDFRFAAGLIGGEVAGKTAITWTWQVGLEAGVEFYIVDRTFLSASIGWVHPSYRGFDLAKSQARMTLDPDYLDFAIDTYTFKISLGL